MLSRSFSTLRLCALALRSASNVSDVCLNLPVGAPNSSRTGSRQTTWYRTTEVLRTATEVYNPDDTIDLLGLLIVGLPASLPAIAALVVVVRGQKKGKARWKGDREMLGDVHRQTVNDHADDENLRDQIDRMEAAQKLMAEQVAEVRDWQVEHGHDLRGLRQDVGALRGEDRTARAAHDDLVRRVNAFIRREHPGADPL